MRKIIIFFLFLSTIKSQAQYVTIPDPIFRNYINGLVPGSIVGNDLNTSHPGLQTVTMINVQTMGISDLTGVQYFPNLTYLFCNSNFLTTLPVLPSTLQEFYCDNNLLTSLPSLPPGLQWFGCSSNLLTSLPALPSQLYELSCSNNQLTYLPTLPSTLYNLWCGHNQLTSLPALPSQLYELQCYENQLTSLPTLPNSLQYLYVSGNPYIYCLPNIPTNPSFYSNIGNLVCSQQGTPDTWHRMANNPIPRELATAFSIGTKCYLSCGSGYGSLNDLWEFNPATNVWTQKANLPASTRLMPVSFSIGNKGYLGLGQSSASPYNSNDFWEYDPVTNTWLQRANYPGTGYYGNIAFSIGSKGYVGCGEGPYYTFPTSFYEFDPVLNTWTPKANFIGLGRTEASCFTIGSKGYVCGGDWYNGLTATCYRYDPSSNSWSTIASFPWAFDEAASFSVNGKGFVAAGECCFWNGSWYNTLMEYDTASNSWIQRASIPTYGRIRTVGCSANGRGYVGTGIMPVYNSEGSTQTNDWWEYMPWCIAPSTVIAASGDSAICNGDSVMLYAATGNSYQWKINNVDIPGATSYFYYASAAGIYTCAVTNSCTSLISNPINVIVHVPVTALISAGGPTNFCNASVTLSATTGIGFTYQWRNGTTLITGATLSTYVAATSGSYNCIVTNSCGNFTSNSVIVIANTWPTATLTAGGPTTFCAPGSVVLNANTGPGLSYEWFFNNAFIPGAYQPSYTATLQGNYRCRVSNLCGNLLSSAITVTVMTIPSAAITASGPTTICAPGLVTLNANIGTGLSYQWKLNNIDIPAATFSNYSAGISGNYKCVISNICGITTSNTIAITINPLPSTPGSILGQTTGVCSSFQPFSISPVPNATSYHWTAPSGAYISSGQGTPNVNIIFTSYFSNGNISVRVSNSCDTSAASAILVSGMPALPGTITGPTSVCHHQNNVIYSIAPVAGATSYTWTVPLGTQVKQGQGTNQIRVRFGNSAGNITVTANNACGQGLVRILAIAMPCKEEITNNDFDVTLYPNPASDKLFVTCYPFSGNESLTIFNAVGESVLKSGIRNQESGIDINALPAGIYFAEIISGTEKKVLKFVKE